MLSATGSVGGQQHQKGDPMYRRVAMGLLSLVIAFCPMVRAADKPDDNRIVIDSKVLGEQRVALVRTPAGYDHGDQRYPVLYMTDGPAQLAHTASTIDFLARNGRMPEMIVVAINNTDRTRDLTPTTPKATGSSEYPAPPGKTGGADEFLTFIETELIPQVEKTYRTQPYRIFAGHSLGGLLAVHAFAKKNDVFNAYIAVSPSLWWDQQVAIGELADFLKDRKELDRKLFITLGDEKGGMRPGFDKAKEVLAKQQLKDFTWDTMLMEDEDHGTVVLRSHYFGLKKIFDGWKADPKVLAGGLPAVEKFYADLSTKYKYAIVPAENLMNQLGYQLFGDGKKDEAVAVLKSNVERYPNSANVYDSLAEIYEKSGKLDLAAPNYERAVQLGTKNSDPNLPVYKTNFERVTKAIKDGNKTGEK
jgi:predicted alpha/beta superfamily hydrolase